MTRRLTLHCSYSNMTRVIEIAVVIGNQYLSSSKALGVHRGKAYRSKPCIPGKLNISQAGGFDPNLGRVK